MRSRCRRKKKAGSAEDNEAPRQGRHHKTWNADMTKEGEAGGQRERKEKVMGNSAPVNKREKKSAVTSSGGRDLVIQSERA